MDVSKIKDSSAELVGRSSHICGRIAGGLALRSGSAKGLSHAVKLPDHPQLRALDIGFEGGEFSAHGLSPQLQPSLTSLKVSKCSIEMKGLSQIGNMLDLEQLDFTHVTFSADRASHFQVLQRL